MAKAPVMRLTARRTASSSGMALGVGAWTTASAMSARWVRSPGLRLMPLAGDDLGVGLGEELVALGDEHLLQGQVVFDDAVVDDDEGPRPVAVWVCVLFRGPAVRGPASVADAEGAVHGGLRDDGFEVAKLAGGAAELEAVGATGDGDAGGVVTAVLEAAKTFNDGGDD